MTTAIDRIKAVIDEAIATDDRAMAEECLQALTTAQAFAYTRHLVFCANAIHNQSIMDVYAGQTQA